MLTALYDERGTIGVTEYEKLLQTLLWSSDRIWLPPQARLDPAMERETTRYLRSQLDDLIEAGLLASFSIEHGMKFDDRGTLIPAKNSATTIPYEDYQQLYADIRESTIRYGEQIRQRHPGQPRLEGVTEFVTLQSHLWTICLARALEADHALTAENRSQVFFHQLDKAQQAADLYAPAAQALMQMTQTGPLSGLTTDQVLELRRYLPQVRSFLDTTINSVLSRRPLADVEELQDLVKEKVTQEYVALLSEYYKTRAQRIKGLSTDVAISVLGVLYPPLSALAFIRPIAEWVESQRGVRRVIMFNMKLQAMTTPPSTVKS